MALSQCAMWLLAQSRLKLRSLRHLETSDPMTHCRNVIFQKTEPSAALLWETSELQSRLSAVHKNRSQYERVILLCGLAEPVVRCWVWYQLPPLFCRTVHCYSYHFRLLYSSNNWKHRLVSEECVNSVSCRAHSVFILLVLLLSFLLITIYFSYGSISHLCADTESEHSV